MLNNINIKTFNKWALLDKDKAMEDGHRKSVNHMIQIIKRETNIMNFPFNFLDLGCGNGWVVKDFSSQHNCTFSLGIDGAENMIRKAKKNIPDSEFIHSDIENWTYHQKFDIIFSMETFYYFKKPNKVIEKMYQLLNENGIFIIGIDHYLENKESLNWDIQYNLKTTTLKKEDWVKLFKNNKFKKVQTDQYGRKNNWQGTLIIYGKK